MSVSSSLVQECQNVAAACVCFNLRRAARAVTQHYEVLMRDAATPSLLRATQFTIAIALAQAPSAPVGRLADALVMDRTTLTRNVAPLIRDGFVVESRAPGDRRTRLLALTPRGERELGRALVAWRKAQRELARRLGEPKLDALLGLLSTTVAAARG